MELNTLYDIAEKENLKIYDLYIENCNGCYLNIDKINAIALNYDRLGTYINEKCVLAEELGHYYCDAVYPLTCKDNTVISKNEYRAKKWALKALISPSALNDIANKGKCFKYEIAEEIGVTEDLLEMAYNYYKENNYISVGG